MKRILKSKLPELWELINTHFDLFLPMEQGSLINFGAYSLDKNIRLDVLKQILQLKSLFFHKLKHI